jgi:hypothetical protein
VGAAAAPPSVAATAAAPDPGGRDAAAETEQGKYSITTLRFQVRERLSSVVALWVPFLEYRKCIIDGFVSKFFSSVRDSCHFGADPDLDLQIRTSDWRIHIQLLSSVTLRTKHKAQKKMFSSYFLL